MKLFFMEGVGAVPELLSCTQLASRPWQGDRSRTLMCSQGVAWWVQQQGTI